MSEPAGWEDVVLPVFEQPEPPKPRRPKTLKEIDDEERKVRYLKAGNAGHCQDCIDEIRAGDEHYPRHAAYVRKVRGEERFLCFQHTQQWRDKDGLEALHP